MDDDFGGGNSDTSYSYDPGPSQDTYSQSSDPTPPAETHYEPCPVDPVQTSGNGNDQPSVYCDALTEPHHHHHEGSGTTIDFGRNEDSGANATSGDWLLNPLNPFSPLYHRQDGEELSARDGSRTVYPNAPHYNPARSKVDAPVNIFDYGRNGATLPIQTQHAKPNSWHGDWLRQTMGAGFGLVGVIRLGTELAKHVAGVPADLGNVVEGVADIAATGIALKLTTPQEGASPHLAQRLLAGALGLPVFVGATGMAILEATAMAFGNEPVSPPTVSRLVEEVAGAVGSYRFVKRGTQGPQQ